MSQSTEKKVVDNRLSLIKQNVELIENGDDNFYAELIKLIGNYIDQLYDKEVDDFPSIVFDENGKIISQDYDELNSHDMFNLTKANRELSVQLFEYVCDILEGNKDIKLDIETLKSLLNRNPKLFSLSVEKSYLYRTFDYKRLSKIISGNQTIEKSNISIDDIYQLLLDTCQLNNNDVFGSLVKSEQFNQNHQKIDEILTWCNAENFVAITNIIRCNFDKDFDRFSIVKKRNKNKFCENLIIQLLHWPGDKEACDLIHQILTDSEIEIDYDLYSADYIGETDLKSLIALSENKTFIKDLLGKEQNIQNYYGRGDFGIQLYILYAIIGDYEKALANFEEQYNFKYDLDDEDENWDSSGYADGNWGYKDSLARFISSMCSSFKEDSIDYSVMINLINRIINSENVKYMNLHETLTPIQEVLSVDDFKLLVDALLEKHNSGNLGFVAVNDHEDMLTRYIISIASEDDVQNHLSLLNKKEKTNVLSIKRTKKKE